VKKYLNRTVPACLLGAGIFISSVAGAKEPETADSSFKDESKKEEPSKEGKATPRVDQDWRNAVSESEKDKARTLFREGNSLVKDSIFSQAALQYEAALAIWDHPGIHYNLALALLNSDQPLKLRQHLLGSLKYGPESLGDDKARRAEQYLKLVEKQLSKIVVSSQHKGARVELDGKYLFTAPGSHSDTLRPGQHTVKASAQGYEATERPVSLVSGKTTTIALKLYKPEDWIRYERRWNKWGPIITTITGASIWAAGGITYWQGREQTKRYDQEVTDKCSDAPCPAGTITSSNGETLQWIGKISLGVGAATTLTGAVLLYLNREIAHRVDPGAKDQLSFTPVFGTDIAGFVGQGTF